MFKQSLNTNLRAAFCSLLVALIASLALAQTTQFTYQGLLNDGGLPANGQYDLQIKLFDTLAGGVQQGATVTLDNVQVTNGLFNVTLDFGAAAFPGANRFLEIGVRPGTSTGAYTALTPRQQLTSTPYSIRSLSAAQADGLSLACVNCVTSSQIASLPTGSSSYIQSNPASQQANSSFSISGNGLIGGNVGIGTITPAGKLEVLSTTAGANLLVSNFGSGLTPNILGRRALGTPTGPTAVSSFSDLLAIDGQGYTGSTFATGARIMMESTENWTSGARGSQIQFLTAPKGATGLQTRMTIGQNGNVGIGNIDFASIKLRVEASGSFDGIWGISPSGVGIRGITETGYAGYFQGKAAINTSSGNIPSSYAGADAALAIVHPAGDWGLAITRAANDNGHANLLLYKTRNTDASIPTALQLNDRIGRVAWYGPDWQNTVQHWATIDALVQSPGNSSFGHTASLRFTAAQDGANNTAMEFFGATGTLTVPILSITGGSDLSEQFEVNEGIGTDKQPSSTSIQSGMVVSIDPTNPGELVLSNQAYDRKVAGIISGAGGVKTGMMMGQTGSIADGKHAVALTGRVYCWVDASNGPVNPGDLLTTSGTPGYAMKVVDHQQAQGAIIGKAMTSLTDGKGLVLVLVSLQ